MRKKSGKISAAKIGIGFMTGGISLLFTGVRNKSAAKEQSNDIVFAKTLQAADLLGTDLVEMSFHAETCAECAKYQGRVFSISGQDKRFPRLPPQVLTIGGIHYGCRHTFYPFIYGVSAPAYTKEDIIYFSNRPF